LLRRGGNGFPHFSRSSWVRWRGICGTYSSIYRSACPLAPACFGRSHPRRWSASRLCRERIDCHGCEETNEFVCEPNRGERSVLPLRKHPTALRGFGSPVRNQSRDSFCAEWSGRPRFRSLSGRLKIKYAIQSTPRELMCSGRFGDRTTPRVFPGAANTRALCFSKLIRPSARCEVGSRRSCHRHRGPALIGKQVLAPSPDTRKPTSSVSQSMISQADVVERHRGRPSKKPRILLGASSPRLCSFSPAPPLP